MASEQNFVTLYNSRAHVFQINPKTKNSWLTKDEQAIPIALVASIGNEGFPSESSTNRRELKIIATNFEGETVLDATISPKTIFNKRAEKFGQWCDPTGTVYGLGFNSESEIAEFMDTFHRLQRDILSNPAQPKHSTLSGHMQSQTASAGAKMAWDQQHLNDSSETNIKERNQDGDHEINNNKMPLSNSLVQEQMKRQLAQNTGNTSFPNNSAHDNGTATNNGSVYPRSQSMFGLQTRKMPKNNEVLSSPILNDLQQYKYENERLKQALEESSKNAGMWHNELLTLRTNNVKLTQALQESKGHVEEWERELLSLRDENKALKLRVLALEASNDPEKAGEYKKDIEKYKNYVDDVQKELLKKENELEELQKSMEELELKTQNGTHDDSHVSQLALGPHHKQKFDIIGAKLESRINELASIHEEFLKLVGKL